MKWHSPHKKRNWKGKNKKSTHPCKKLTRNQRKRKVYMNKPKSKKRRDKIGISLTSKSLSSVKEPSLIYTQIINKKTGERILSFSHDDIIDVDPLKHYKESFIIKNMIVNGMSNDELSGKTEISEFDKDKFIEAHQLWNKLYKEITDTEVPKNLILLLSDNNKNKQESLLKKVSLSPNILSAFIFEAYKKHGFQFSEYKSETLPKGFDSAKMPFAFNIENENVKKYGETTLSDGQLKQVIDQRKVIVAKFLDDGVNWHCFIVTYKSLRGEEAWKEGQPHYHYVSNKFNIKKEEVIQQIQNGKYPKTSVHIRLLEYGNQPIGLID